ncbi:TIGR03943 family protein [Nostoc sp. UCD121]|uniref:TIGR03943 family putative permease subunit n=1 Tax=unclassified Nostoc TaxID=2593658 RepID=UPI00162335CB|nr:MULTISPECIES: TIGR03943 family protein [unclassified Nostoc]MBC1224925.1 TIGR03943 family protein [Nostoc sp. UCD120]MBC1279753.1 TIGR03943 family protein [Nostoc sp. UCD121]MBC1297901.1 TIGR03943 family protein [Nostoc sp. UCD122]
MANKKTKSKIPNLLLPWLDALAITAWGILMLRYWLTNKLNLLIHPNYFWLVIVCGICLIIIGSFKIQELWQRRRRDVMPNSQHISLFPPGWGSVLLLITAILGFIITPQVFASDKALQRGVTTDLLGSTRVKPQAFRATVRPEERSLVDWVRTVNVYPEPDAYTGQKVKVQGFVIHPPDIGKEYLFLARFVLTCCAADAYPIGLPVKLPNNQERYSPDTWLEVEGQMTTENLAGKRQLTIAATSLKKIPQPQNPYSY